MEVTNNFKYIRITNKNRTSGTPTNFSYDLSNDTTLHKIQSAWIQSVTIPNLFYNIDTHNNVLVFSATQTGGGSSLTNTIVVAPGFYSTSQLLNEITTLLNTALIPLSGTVTFTQGINTNLISYTTTGLDGLRLFSIVDNPISTMSEPLGIEGVTTEVPAVVFDGMPALSGESMIYLHSKDINLAGTVISTLNNPNSLTNSNRNVSTFCSIPVTVPFYSNIHYESEGSVIDHISLEGARDLANINIKVRSVNGRLLTLSENQELTIVIKVFYT